MSHQPRSIGRGEHHSSAEGPNDPNRNSRRWAAWLAFTCALSAALLLASCNRSLLDLTPPTPIPSPTLPPPTAISTATPTSTSVPPTQVGPPTASPPELGEPIELPKLAPGSEALVQHIQMTDALRGWAVGGIAGDDGRVLRTDDGAVSWQDVSPPTFFADGGAELVTKAAFLDSDHAWVVRYTPIQGEPAGGGVPLVTWITEDGGASWAHGQPIFVPFIGTDFAEPYLLFADPENGWLLGRLGGAGMHQYPVSLYGTGDGGMSWQILSEPFGTEDAGLMSCYKSGMAFDTAGTGVLTIESCPITGAEVLLTEDGGQSWTPITLPEPTTHPGLYDSASCESHSPAILDGGEIKVGVMCRTFDGNVGDQAFLYTSTDDGAHWATVESVPGELIFLSPETLWATGHELYRSLDGGETWVQVKLVSWQGQFSFVSEDLGWAVARSDADLAFVKTTNGGRTWSLEEPVIAP
ncbi:MAG: hypothetical protein WBR18_05890 [Anaerolineales bacterium]